MQARWPRDGGGEYENKKDGIDYSGNRNRAARSLICNANNCSGLQNQLNHADWKLRQGGNSSYMKYWRQSRDGVDKKLSQCKKSYGNGEPQIHLYTGANKEQAENRYVVASDINDPALQQLIKTCNYWIN